VLLSWDGDYDSGYRYVCNSSGTAIEGTNNGLAVSTSYGESGSYGSYHDSVDERIDWSQTDDQYFDQEGAQTLWMRINITGTPDQNIVIFEASYDSSNVISVSVLNTGKVVGYYKANNVIASVYCATAPSTGSWVDVAYSWDKPNEDHATYDGSVWYEETDEISDTPASGLIVYTLGNNIVWQSATPSTNEVYVTQWALVNGYEASKPW
jgi:hypothetical protein